MYRVWSFSGILLWFTAAFLVVPTSQAQKLSSRLTNQDVLAMVSMGLSDEVIVDKITATGNTDFDTSVEGLRALKAGKVSDRVIRAMITPPGATSSPKLGSLSVSTQEYREPAEAGVFLALNGKLLEIDPEIVGWQTGGVLKTMATLGLDKGHVNGKVMQPRSTVQVMTPVEFVVRTLEGTSVSEFQLLKLYKKGNRREFRAVTGGILHVKGGSERNHVAFTTEKTGTRTWHIRLTELPLGEYGFLPPGISAASIGSSGKIYSFEVVENSSSRDVQPGRDVGIHSQIVKSETSKHEEEGSIGVGLEGNPDIRHDGVTVASLSDGGPASGAGIQVGDVILAINGTYVFTGQDLTKIVRGLKPGSSVVINWRHSSSMNVKSIVVSGRASN